MSKSITVDKATRQKISYTITDADGNNLDLTKADTVTLVAAPDLETDTSEIVLDLVADSVDANGNAEWKLDAEQTDIRTGLYNFEIVIDYGNDQVTTPERDKLFIKKRVEK